MLTGASAGDIEQAALGFVYVVELRFVRGVGDALVERQRSFVTRHHDDGTKFQTFG